MAMMEKGKIRDGILARKKSAANRAVECERKAYELHAMAKKLREMSKDLHREVFGPFTLCDDEKYVLNVEHLEKGQTIPEGTVLINKGDEFNVDGYSYICSGVEHYFDDESMYFSSWSDQKVVP